MAYLRRLKSVKKWPNKSSKSHSVKFNIFISIHQVSFSWKKNHYTVPKSQRLTTADIEKGCFLISGVFHHHNDPSILVVCSIDIYSEANYTCIATNVYGSTSKSMQFRVMRKSVRAIFVRTNSIFFFYKKVEYTHLALKVS